MNKLIYKICLSFMAYKAKTKETKMEKRAKELQTFRSTFAALRKKFTLEELSRITGIHSSNLSAYGSGYKDPSLATIGIFYATLKAEIDKLPKPRKATKTTGKQTGPVEEERSPYGRTKRSKDITADLLRLLTDNQGKLWADNEKSSKRLDKVIENNTKLADSNSKMADSNSKLADNNGALVNNNTQMISNYTRLVEKLFSPPGDSPSAG
jgi:hypothetical protein